MESSSPDKPTAPFEIDKAKKLFGRFTVSKRVALITLLALLTVGGIIFFIVSKPPSQSSVEKKATSQASCPAYKVAAGQTSGWFKSGQNADIALSAIDFNNSGGPLLFNHPGNIASDGSRLLLADRNNNRILIWNKLPSQNSEPDLVLGQKNFTANNPGSELDQLNWPVGLATDGSHILVADTYNDRILIWNNWPSQNGQPADLEIKGSSSGGAPQPGSDPKRQIGWPWAVWTNGEKMIVTSTASASVLIWNSFPIKSGQPADLILYANKNFGTPRAIASDGKRLMIGDHNSKVSGGAGNFFWKSLPSRDDQPYDFFVDAAERMGEARPPQAGNQSPPGDILWGGTFTSDGKFLAAANRLYIWNSFPESQDDGPDLKVGFSGPRTQAGYGFAFGDGSGIALAGDKLYVGLSNGNKIVAFNQLPTKEDQKPDFAVGAPDIKTNTLETNYLITNPVPASNGKSLLVSSDFDRKLYVWKKIPDQSGACPDVVLPYGGWDNELHGDKFALAGKREVYIWKKLPLSGEKPDFEIKDQLGSVNFQDIGGVAFDDKYFYLADFMANKIYVYNGFPQSDSEPLFVLNTSQPRRLHSDGKYLVVTATLDNENGHVRLYKIDGLGPASQPITIASPRGDIHTNLPEQAIAEGDHLFIADTGFNRVLAWKSIEDALNKKPADVILGADSLDELKPELGRNKLFWPAGLAWDGNYLWVGEFKFSGRILRFSPTP